MEYERPKQDKKFTEPILLVASPESLPGCFGDYPESFDGNKCAFCAIEIKFQCQIIAENKPRTRKK